MSPMKSLQFFQPMVHVPLNKIESVYRLPKKANEYLVYSKPKGIDVYMTNGRIYDFNHKELTNKTLLFTFEKVLQVTMQTQGLYIGTLVSLSDPVKMLQHQPMLYTDDNMLPINPRFIVYDIIFPYFKVENPFWIRYDIAKKTIGEMPHCSSVGLREIEKITDIKSLIKERFNIDRIESFIVFDKDGRYHSGNRQLSYGLYEQVSFEISASQKYRAHIKKILPIDVDIQGKVVTIAGSIEARFKNTELDIPVNKINYILRKNMWDKRKELKRMPFIFEGLYYEEDDNFEILGAHYSKFIL